MPRHANPGHDNPDQMPRLVSRVNVDFPYCESAICIVVIRYAITHEKKAQKMTKNQDTTVRLIASPVARDQTRFSIWIVGTTPLITHAWSEKARREMLSKQTKKVKAGKEMRSPEEDFVNSLYSLGDGKYGFPATGFKNAILSAAHKDKGLARSAVQSALWIDANMARVKPAFAGAICDMPIIRIYGDAPEMREDMVKIGAGLNKIANLAYRGQFTRWAMKVSGQMNSVIITAEAFGFLVDEAGFAIGLGEWRNEKKGVFGSFRRVTAEEQVQLDEYAERDGQGEVPAFMNYGE
jgi:hypothetical protein